MSAYSEERPTNVLENESAVAAPVKVLDGSPHHERSEYGPLFGVHTEGNVP